MEHPPVLDTLNALNPNLLNGFAPDEVSALARCCEHRTYPDQHKLITEDERAHKMFLLVKGRVNLCFEMPGGRGCENIVNIEQPGSTIGFSVVVPPHRYHSSGYCIGETGVIEVDGGKLLALFETNYHLAYILTRNIAELVGVRLYQIQGKLTKILGDELMDGW